MIPIIKWELKQRKQSTIWWTVATVLVVGMILAIFPSIRDQANQFNKLLNGLPEGLRQLKTGGSSAVNVADPVSFLNSQLYYITLPILQIILAVNLGSGLLAKDEQEHTLELLLSRPISRSKVLIGKALAGLSIMLVTTVAATLVVIVLAPAIKLNIGIGPLILTNIFSMLFSLSFGVIAFGFSASHVNLRRAASAFAVFLGFGGYLITSLSGLTHYLINPAKVTPYHYYDPTTLLNGRVNKGLAIYLIGSFGLSMLLAWLTFRRRDIS